MKLEIANIEVKQNSDGLYCLNDLHNASGGAAKDKPSNWLASDKTSELINEILIAGKPAIRKSAGRYGGTYICKELVYAYAMWISPAFQLKVISAYDRQVNVHSQLESLIEQVKEKSLGISQAIDLTTRSLKEIKEHGTAWGAYGSSIKKAKMEAIKELKSLQNEIQLKLDLL